MIKKLVVSLLSGLVLSATAGISVMAAEESDPNKEQFFPVLSYWSGPFAPGGSGIAGGWMDYMALLNIVISVTLPSVRWNATSVSRIKVSTAPPFSGRCQQVRPMR